MNFNITLLGKTFYVTPWAIYSTGVTSSRTFAFNEFETTYTSKGETNTVEEKTDDGEVEEKTVTKYVPHMNLEGVDEDQFQPVFFSYGSALGLVGLGLGARYGYRQRENIGDSVRGLVNRIRGGGAGSSGA